MSEKTRRAPGDATVGIGTLLRYLVGSREAILQIAGSRHALWIGLLFVLSAGFAREYDGEDLLNEPWYLLLPILASLVSSFLLFLAAYGVSMLKGEDQWAFLPRYASFLGLFWLTAPLAWLYAIPYERFCTPVDAVRLNLITLGVVSAWRVALMTRVLTVLWGYSVGAALCLVLVFADVVALSLLQFLPVPLIAVMGGVRLSESERLLRSVAFQVGCLGFVTLPLWIGAGLVFLYRSKAAWQETVIAGGRPRIGLVALAFASVLVWLPILPHTQPEQQQRRVVEKLYQQGERVEALRFLSSHPREAFPPHWAPPGTSVDFRVTSASDFLTFVEEFSDLDTGSWVREEYFQMVRRVLQHALSDLVFFFREEDWRRFGKVLEKSPEGRDILEEVKSSEPRLYAMMRS
jgi:hypothetical protein